VGLFHLGVRTSNSLFRQLTDFGQTLEECQTLLCLPETGLEVQKALLVEEFERDLHPPDGQDRNNSEHAAEVEWLSRHVMRISRVLVDLGMLSVQGIP
jgi:hypothetical protein